MSPAAIVEAVKRVVAAMSDRPIVVLSVVDDDNFGSRVVAAGAEDCLFIERLEAIRAAGRTRP